MRNYHSDNVFLLHVSLCYKGYTNNAVTNLTWSEKRTQTSECLHVFDGIGWMKLVSRCFLVCMLRV